MPQEAKPSGFLGKLSILTIGFGLHNTWVFSVMFSTSSVFETNIHLPGIHGSDFSLVYLISAIIFGGCLLFAAVKDQKLLRLFVSRKTLVGNALLASFGTLVLLIPTDNYTLNIILEIISGLATGVGSAFLLLFWGITFARDGAVSIVLNGALGVIAGLIINVLLLHIIPYPFGGLCTAIIPLIEWVILAHIFPKPFSGKNDTPYFHSLPTNKKSLAFHLGVPVFALGFALGILRQTSVQTTISNATSATDTIMLLLAGGMTLLTFGVFMAIQDSSHWDRLLRIRVPIIMMVMLLLSLIVSENKIFANLFLLISYMCFEALMWITFSYISHRFRLSPIFVFGLGRGVIAIASLVGMTVPVLVSPWFDYAYFGDYGQIIGALILMIIGYALMPPVPKIESLIVRCPLVRLVSIELDEGIPLLDAHKNTGVSAAQSLENKGMLGSLGPDGALEQTGKHKGGRFSQKVNKVAKTYLLTERETDILFELAKGQSPTYIQEKYYISEGTVKTHIRNIYRKLNIHKRTALMRLIEEAEIDE